MNMIVVVALALLGFFLIVILVLFLLIARNLKSMAAAVARATALAETVERQGTGPALTPAPKRSMKEIFAALPSLLKRADNLK
jgi:hypothetical protein